MRFERWGLKRNLGTEKWGRSCANIYLARGLNGRRRKESVAGNDDRLDGLEYVSLALQLRRGVLSLFFMQSAAFVPVVYGVVRGRSDAVEEWRWRRK
jgi:hypothetical protein